MAFLEIFRQAMRKPRKAFTIEELSEEELRAIAEAESPDNIEYMDEDSV